MSHLLERLDGLLATDQYQLAMAQVYWKEGLADRDARFDYFFRRYPTTGLIKRAIA
jgi:nicotinate phosphoribosyltransferase